MLRWPEDVVEAGVLAGLERPRLLLVAPHADPPEGGACEEDWVREPVDEEDIAARLRSLRRRIDRHLSAPEVDGLGRLLHRGGWVALSPIEERLVSVLVEHFRAVVPADQLIARAWPDRQSTPNALRVQLNRLRRHIAPLDLEIFAVRSRGLILDERSGPRVSSVGQRGLGAPSRSAPGPPLGAARIADAVRL